MKKLTSVILTCWGLLWPALARAGEKEVKAAFLLQGGIGGILIGAGLYACFMLLSAVLFKSKAALAMFFALSTAIFVYIQYWSFYFLAIAVAFMRTRQMQYEFGELTTLLNCVLVFVGAWGVAVFGLALRMWMKRHNKRNIVLLREE
jgi:hypothetical protein